MHGERRSSAASSASLRAMGILDNVRDGIRMTINDFSDRFGAVVVACEPQDGHPLGGEELGSLQYDDVGDLGERGTVQKSRPRGTNLSIYIA